MNKDKTYFKHFKTKHKVYVTVVLMAILLAGNMGFLLYTREHPDKEVMAAVITFFPTCIVMFVVMSIMVKSFQKDYEQPGRDRINGRH